MTVRFLIRTIFTIVAFYVPLSHGAFEVPSAELQQRILLALRNEMIRLDGEGLLSRKDRPETFVETTDKLVKQTLANQSLNDFFNSFQKLSATYTNLHSRAIFSNKVNQQIDLPWYKRQSIWLFAEVDQNDVKMRIDHIEDPSLANISEGDEIVAINGRSIQSWLSENFLFCKYALKIQCHRQFESNLLSLNLSWKGDTDLIYTVKHQDQKIDVKLTFSEDTTTRDPLRKRCDWNESKRYKGFKRIHLGFFACLYEKEDNPEVALLRIASFQYNRNQDPMNPFKSIYEEVEALEKIWIPKSANYKHLIIDVLNNHGGNLPVPYYQILFKGKFQEQYVQFKKTPEFEDKRLRDAILWGDSSHELQFQKYLNNGFWQSLEYGDFTLPEPMFCADSNKPCSETSFEAKEHDFSGQVYIMLNEECVSSCDGFTWAMKTKLNAKLYGFYQAADAAYSRLRIDAVLDSNHENGFKIIINPERAPLDSNFIVGQTIAVSRATDANGNVFNGHPLELEELVPYRFGEFYPSVVLEKVLNRIASEKLIHF